MTPRYCRARFPSPHETRPQSFGYGCTVCGRRDRRLHPSAWWVKNAGGRRIGESVVRGSFCSYLCFEVWALAVERDQLSDRECWCGAPQAKDGRCLLLEKHAMEETG